MLFSYNWLQSFFEKKLPQPSELARLIVGHCFEVESMEKSGKDTVFDIAILSNRPDCFSHTGIAREIAAILGYKLNLPKTKLARTKPAPAVKSFIDVLVTDAVACPRYTAKVVTGVTVGPSPKWVEERLVACGLRSINNIVDATNYVMLETGQPLHAFDWDKLAQGKLKAKKIIVRPAEKGEIIDVLGEKKYELSASMLLIADEAGPLAIAGIKGGKRAEISAQTSTIVIEAANFNSKTIRIASRNLGLVTDASLRYAHGLDRGQTAEVAERLAEIVIQIAGGQIAAGTIDRNPQPVKPKKIILDMDSAESLLGADIQTARAKKILESLGLAVRRGVKSNLEVMVPARRTDIVIEEDLIEEIGRIDGYEKIASVPAGGLVLPPAKNYFWLWKSVVRESLIEAGWSETRNYSFVSEKDGKNYKFELKSILEIKNPVTADFRFMRPSLLINLVKNIAKNPGHEDLRQFEIGKIFGKSKRDEPTMIAGVAAKASYFEAKGAVEFMLRRLGIAKLSFEPLKESVIYNVARSAVIISNRKEIGLIGQLNDEVAAAAGVKPVVVFELDLDILAQMATRRNDYRPISMHPAAIRDLALLTPRRELAQNIINEIESAAGPLVISVEPIDIYEGGQIPPNLKNIAFRINYQSMERTLGGSQIDALQAKVIAAAESRGWQVRK